MLIKLYETYNKVKDVFKKPVLKFSACKWQGSGFLPVWRHGNMIYFGKQHQEYFTNWNYARLVSSEWTGLGKQKHPILSRIFKPVYQLPIWLSFYIFNHDMYWKTKYDEYRFEYPPQFTIVLFGWSFNWWLINPTGDVKYDADYWESILNYLEYKDDPNWKEKVNKSMGQWKCSDGSIRDAFNEKNFLK
jgi:hypothetical protein